ncbi:MAG: hypothetical protein NT031_02310 [Planctomycetota bacterium]|nr:hypothetical protein [Planctomycetota bacterium]
MDDPPPVGLPDEGGAQALTGRLREQLGDPGLAEVGVDNEHFPPAAGDGGGQVQRHAGPSVLGHGAGDHQDASLIGGSAEQQAGADLPEGFGHHRVGALREGHREVFHALFQVVGVGHDAQQGQVHAAGDVAGTLDGRVQQFQSERQARPDQQAQQHTQRNH